MVSEEATFKVTGLSTFPPKKSRKGVTEYSYLVQFTGPNLPKDDTWIKCETSGLQEGRTYRCGKVESWEYQNKWYFAVRGDVVPEGLALPAGQPQPAPNPQPQAAPAPQPAPEEVKNFLPGEYVAAACSVARDVVTELPGADPSTVNTVLITLFRDCAIIDRLLCRRAAGKEGA
jgi:hypothetical protein